MTRKIYNSARIEELEERNYNLSEIIDIDFITSICEQFTKLTGFVTALLELDGTVIVATGWQRICTHYHRVNGKALQRCTESDIYIGSKLESNQEYTIYSCKNGLCDAAIPVKVGERHVGNFFTGQFFLEGDVKPREYFVKQAAELGIEDVEGYLKAYEMVPVFTEEKVRTALEFLVNIVEMIGHMTRSEAEKLELQEQLSQTQKMEAVGQLAGGIAHDFNNTLGGIIGAAQLLKKPACGLNEKGLKYVDLIIQAVQNADELTGKLLTFSQKNFTISKSLNIHNLISDSIMILWKTIDKKVKIHFKNLAENPMIKGEPGMLQNIFVNLAINSSQAMEKGGEILITTSNVTLSAEESGKGKIHLKPGEYVQIDFSDTGAGIPRETLPRIFDPFFSTRDREKGAGLGLSAVYGTVKDHKGHISVESEVGKGTVFHIYLPSSGETPLRPEEERDEPVRGSGTILLVDDEEMIRITGTSLLEEMGYDVLTAQNGTEGIRLFEENRGKIKAVVLDMIMPDIDGTEVFQRIHEAAPLCPVIIASGFTSDKKVDALLDKGLFAILKKPFLTAELSRLLNKAITEK
ncbi:MAG: PocR ligand-binding domain-containing protein [Spirochaetales bacterium]|nr:PocR ligand-binding domain-containing protein [Spirochaetales bacterium]